MPAATIFNSETGRAAVAKSWLPGSKRFLPKQEKLVTVELPKDSVDTFREQSANRTREQMQLIQGKIQAELDKPKLDSKVLKELTEALARLETIEQKLSGRASPGSLRPSSKAGRAKQTYSAPTPEVDEAGPENG